MDKPTDDDLTRLRETLTPLLLDIPYDALEGKPNLWGIIADKAAYLTKYGSAFVIPVQVAAYNPVIKDDDSPGTRAKLELEHAAKSSNKSRHGAAERAVAKFIRDALPETWYRQLKDADTFYTDITAQELMTHLLVDCEGLHALNVVELPTQMFTFWSDTEGIPQYINKLEDAQHKSL